MFQKYLTLITKKHIKSSLIWDSYFDLRISFLYLFGILGALLPFSYCIATIQEHTQKNEFVIFLSKLIRPNLFFINSNTSFIHYCLSCWIVVYLLNFFLSITLIEDSQKKNIYYIGFQRLFFIFNQILDIWLINIILEILFDQGQIYTYIVSAAYIIILIYRIIITKVRVFFSFESFNHQISINTYYVIQLLNFIQILVFSFSKNQYYYYIQTSLSLVVCFMQIYQTIIKLPQNNFNILLVQFFIHLLTTIYIFGNIILQQYIQNYQKESLQIILLIIPFFVKFSTTIKTYIMYRQLNFLNNQCGLVHQYFFQISNETDFFQKYSKYQLHSKYEIKINKNSKSSCFEQIKLKQNLNQNKTQSINDQIHNIKLHILLQEYYQAYGLIRKLPQQNSLLIRTQIEIFAQKCLEELKQQMIFINQAQKKSLNIEGFITVETTSYDLSQELIECCVRKKQFYEFSLRQIGKDEIQSYANSLIVEFECIIQKLEAYSKQFPLLRFQRCLAFARAELCNDILEAIKISSSSAFPDETIYTKILTLTEEFQSQKTIYMISNLENQQILKVSPNFNNLFNVQNIIELVPNGIKEHHEFMIQEFIKTGKSILYLNVSQTYYEIGDYIQPINMLIDVIVDDNQMKAITIATLPDEEEIMLIVSCQYKIASFSKSFENQIYFPENQIHHIKGLDVQVIIPNFYQICDNNQQQHCELKFLNYEYVQSKIDIRQSNSTIIDTYKDSQLKNFWINKPKLDDYISLCQIKKSKFGFFMIYFSYIKNVTKTKFFPKSLKSFTKFQINSMRDLEEEVKIALPYEQNELDIQLSSKSDLLNTNRNEIQKTLIQSSDFNPFNSNYRKNGPPTLIIIKEIENENEKKEFKNNSVQLFSQSMKEKNKIMYEMQNYNKYSLFEKIKDKNLFKLEQMFITILLIHLIYFFSQILSNLIINTDMLKSNMENLALLKIKYDLFQPVESFIVTRYTIINYNTLFSAKQITQAQLNQYLKFPNSNLNLGFDDVQENQEYILNSLPLSDFLSQYHDFYIYKSTDIGELYNITMRQALSILINYQYTFKAAYKYDGRTVSDSPYIFYSYRNLLTLYNAFDQLRKEVYDFTLQTMQFQQSKETDIFILFVISTSLFFFFELYYSYKNSKVIDKFIFLLNYTHPILFQKEINRIESYILQYIKNPEKLYSYKFTIEQKENDLIGLCLTNKSYSNIKKKKRFSRKILNKFHFIALLVQLLVMMSYLLTSHIIIQSFFNKFEPTCFFYSEMAELGTNVPTIYAMREVLYFRWRYPFYQQKELGMILNQIVTCIKQVQNMTIFFQERDINNLLISEKFNEQLEIYQTQDLCPKLPNNFTQMSSNFCNITLDASLTKGLQSSLVYVYSSIANEMEVNKFMNKTQNTINELEGVFILTQLLKSLNQDLLQDILQITNNFDQNLIVISALYLVFLALAIILVIWLLGPSLRKQFYLGKRYLYLIPQPVLYGDDSFERIARGLLQQI